MSYHSRNFLSAFVSVLTLTIFTVLNSSFLHASPEVGAAAPAFTAKDSSGKTIDLKALAGKTVVLEWTNDGCPFVQKHYGSGNMQALQKEATDNGIVWISVISSAPGKQGHVDAEEANKLTTDRKANPTSVILDPSGKIGKMYEATATPNMFVIDAKGTLVYKGAIDDKPTANPADIETASNYVKLALKSVAEGKPVEKSVTRPYGCSVKY